MYSNVGASKGQRTPTVHFLHAENLARKIKTNPAPISKDINTVQQEIPTPPPPLVLRCMADIVYVGL